VLPQPERTHRQAEHRKIRPRTRSHGDVRQLAVRYVSRHSRPPADPCEAGPQSFAMQVHGAPDRRHDMNDFYDLSKNPFHLVYYHHHHQSQFDYLISVLASVRSVHISLQNYSCRILSRTIPRSETHHLTQNTKHDIRKSLTATKNPQTTLRCSARAGSLSAGPSIHPTCMRERIRRILLDPEQGCCCVLPA
jgi:hypothetical protein